MITRRFLTSYYMKFCKVYNISSSVLSKLFYIKHYKTYSNRNEKYMQPYKYSSFFRWNIPERMVYKKRFYIYLKDQSK